jgi:photosystem II stability/assembly factor-like uncharacterized protein
MVPFRAFLLSIFTASSLVGSAQIWKALRPASDQPAWEQQLWGQPWTVTSRTEVAEVQQAYEEFRRQNPNSPKTYADRYVRAWGRHNLVWASLAKPTQATGQSQLTEGLGTWTPIGPTYVRDGLNAPSGEHANIYTIAMAGGSALYAGTEPGQVYRSDNQGLSWTLTALNVPFAGGIQALAGNPLNSQALFAATYEAIYRSVDGGQTWVIVRQGSNLSPNELLVAAHDTNLVYAATQSGLLRSADRGTTWTTVLPQATYDVKFMPGGISGRTVYALSGSGQENAVFYRSQNHGLNFTLMASGWYQSSNPNRVDFGGRIAVTPTDSNRVYAYLIGDSKPGDNGFIGIFRSSDRGATWTNPRGVVGAPYSATAPNTAIGAPGWTYHQGFYNCFLAVHPTNPDELLIGGLSLWKSTDAGATAVAMAGYAADSVRMHVDMQDIRQFLDPSGAMITWISTDGGIYRSTDFVQTQPDLRMQGIQATEFWALGQGWNEDVLVAGAYHNGVLARREAYPTGMFMQLGGGEPASGYADPMTDGRVYSSDIGGAQLPATPSASTPPQYFSYTVFPNESYWPSEASTMVFDPRSPSEILIGLNQKLMRSLDGGQSYQLVNSFGWNPLRKLGQVVQGYKQPGVLYVVQRESGNPALLHRSIDSGATWVQVALPPGTGSRMVLALVPEQAMHLVAVFPEAPDGAKVFRSFNGGQQWANWTTPAVNGQEIRAIVRIQGSSPGWVIGGDKEVFVRFDTSATWSIAGQGLPHPVQTRDLAVHHGLSKIRIATYGRGMWECDLPTPLVQIMAQPMVESRTIWRGGCADDSVRFASRSIAPRSGTAYLWRFPGGFPATSTMANPAVAYPQVGTYQAWLRVSHQGSVDSASVSFTVSAPTGSLVLADFDGSIFPDAFIWTQIDAGGIEWRRSEWTPGNYAAMVDNYYIDAQGAASDLVLKVERATSPESLLYQYAYAPYGPPYSDTLLVVVSPNCDLTAPVWVDTLGGTRLQTAPILTSSLFVPGSASQWKQDTLSFLTPELQTAFQFNPTLYVGFRSIGHYGQALYLDSIELVRNLSISENRAPTPVVLAPNPAKAGSVVQSLPALPQGLLVEWFSSAGKNLGATPVLEGGRVSVPASARGLLLWRAVADDRAWAGSLVVD